MKVKTPRPQTLKKGILYKMLCKDCEKVYIAETGRNLQKRLMKHIVAVRRGDMKSGVAVHAWEQQHEIDWEEANGLKQVPRYWRRRVLEAIVIQKHLNTTNLDCKLMENPIWTSFLSL